jgi:hypothetical protein
MSGPRPAYSVPLGPRPSDPFVVQEANRMKVSEPPLELKSILNYENPVILLNEDPKREVPREHLEYFIQTMQIRKALSETGATVRSESTNLPSAVVFRTNVNIGFDTYNCLIDSGASISAVNPDILSRAKLSIMKRQKIKTFTFKLSVGNSESLCVNEIVTLQFSMNDT